MANKTIELIVVELGQVFQQTPHEQNFSFRRSHRYCSRLRAKFGKTNAFNR